MQTFVFLLVAETPICASPGGIVVADTPADAKEKIISAADYHEITLTSDNIIIVPFSFKNVAFIEDGNTFGW